jgi:thiol-disulfide isomerase/thioredoxin
MFTIMRALIFTFLLILNTALVAQQIPVIKVRELEELIATREKKILVLNFWATWCAPCVKELPYFEAVYQKNDEQTKVVLINLDFADKIEKVKSFVNRKKIQAPVLLLDEIDYNSWIDKVDTSWQGAIPATLIINTQTGQRRFIAKELEDGQLDQIIEEISKS